MGHFGSFSEWQMKQLPKISKGVHRTPRNPLWLLPLVANNCGKHQTWLDKATIIARLASSRTVVLKTVLHFVTVEAKSHYSDNENDNGNDANERILLVELL